MKLSTIAMCGVLTLGLARGAEAQPLDPKGLSSALAAKPTGAAAEQLATQIRAWFGGSEALQKGPAPKIDDLLVAWAVEAPGLAANAPAPRVVSDLVAFTMPLVKVGDDEVVCRRRAAAQTAPRITWHYEIGDRRLGGGQLEVYETPSRQPRAAGRAQGQAQADAGLEEQDLRRHDARLVGLRPGAVQGRRARLRDGLPGRRRLQGLRADRLRQPDRQEGHAGHGRHLHQARASFEDGGGRTGASSTTRSPTSTPGSCSRRSCPRSRRR